MYVPLRRPRLSFFFLCLIFRQLRYFGITGPPLTDDNEKPIVWPKSFKTFFGLYAEIFRVTSLWGKNDQNIFSGSFFGHAVQQVSFSIFNQALINIVQQNTIDVRSRDRNNPWSLLFAPEKVT